MAPPTIVESGLFGIGEAALPEWRLEEFTEYRAARLLNAFVPPALCAIGVTGNVMTLFVLTFSALRHSACCKYLAALALTDTAILILNFCFNFLDVFVLKLRVSDIACKVYYFLFFTSAHLSSWLLVAVTTQRCFVICRPMTSYFVTSNRCTIGVIGGLTLASVILNSHHLIVRDLVWSNATQQFVCYSAGEVSTVFVRDYWPWVDAAVYCFLPASCLVVLNILIIRTLRKAAVFRRLHQNRNHHSQQKSAVKTTERVLRRSNSKFTNVRLTGTHCPSINTQVQEPETKRSLGGNLTFGLSVTRSAAETLPPATPVSEDESASSAASESKNKASSCPLVTDSNINDTSEAISSLHESSMFASIDGTFSSSREPRNANTSSSTSKSFSNPTPPSAPCVTDDVVAKRNNEKKDRDQVITDTVKKVKDKKNGGDNGDTLKKKIKDSKGRYQDSDLKEEIEDINGRDQDFDDTSNKENEDSKDGCQDTESALKKETEDTNNRGKDFDEDKNIQDKDFDEDTDNRDKDFDEDTNIQDKDFDEDKNNRDKDFDDTMKEEIEVKNNRDKDCDDILKKTTDEMKDHNQVFDVAVKKDNETTKGREHSRQLTLMPLLASVVFVTLSAPIAVTLVAEQLVWKRETPHQVRQVAIYTLVRIVVNTLMYINHSVNFLLYCFAGSTFRSQWYSLFCQGRLRKRISKTCCSCICSGCSERQSCSLCRERGGDELTGASCTVQSVAEPQTSFELKDDSQQERFRLKDSERLHASGAACSVLSVANDCTEPQTSIALTDESRQGRFRLKDSERLHASGAACSVLSVANDCTEPQTSIAPTDESRQGRFRLKDSERVERHPSFKSKDIVMEEKQTDLTLKDNKMTIEVKDVRSSQQYVQAEEMSSVKNVDSERFERERFHHIDHSATSNTLKLKTDETRNTSISNYSQKSGISKLDKSADKENRHFRHRPELLSFRWFGRSLKYKTGTEHYPQESSLPGCSQETVYSLQLQNISSD